MRRVRPRHGATCAQLWAGHACNGRHSRCQERLRERGVYDGWCSDRRSGCSNIGRESALHALVCDRFPGCACRLRQRPTRCAPRFHDGWQREWWCERDNRDRWDVATHSVLLRRRRVCERERNDLAVQRQRNSAADLHHAELHRRTRRRTDCRRQVGSADTIGAHHISSAELRHIRVLRSLYRRHVVPRVAGVRARRPVSSQRVV